MTMDCQSSTYAGCISTPLILDITTGDNGLSISKTPWKGERNLKTQHYTWPYQPRPHKKGLGGTDRHHPPGPPTNSTAPWHSPTTDSLGHVAQNQRPRGRNSPQPYRRRSCDDSQPQTLHPADPLTSRPNHRTYRQKGTGTPILTEIPKEIPPWHDDHLEP